MKLPQQAQRIIKTLKKAGFEAYAVGGSVRDLIVGRKTTGWDFTTNAAPEEILKLFPDSFYDNQFGTVGVKIYTSANGKSTKKQNGQDQEREIEDIYEVTTYRKERGYIDHRHPDNVVWGKTIEEDLARRDFTINAIAFDGKTVVDPHDGHADIKKKLIRAVGDPNQRFSEDSLRMMRAIRIAAELGFLIDPPTLASINMHAPLIQKISAERVRDELLKLLASPHPADGILLMKNAGLLGEVLPELDSSFATPQKSPKRHHVYDVGTHSVMALKHCPSTDPLVRLATLLHDIGKPKTFQHASDGVITFYNHEVVGSRMARDIAHRLRLSNKHAEKLFILVRWHQFTVDERQTDSALRRFIRRVGRENLDDMLALRIGDRLGGGARETSWRLELFKKRLEDVQKQPFVVSDLNVDGYDVMKEFNVKPGPLVGKILSQLFSEVESGSLHNERGKLLTRLKELRNQTS